MVKLEYIVVSVAFCLALICCTTTTVIEPGKENTVDALPDDEAEPESERRNAKAISSVKKLIVTERGDEPLVFEKWVAKRFPRSSKINWEVNDCGEQWGHPGQKDFPICVEASAERDGEYYSVSYSVGTYKRGLVEEPKIWSVLVKKNGKSEFGERLEDFKRIIDSFER